MGRVAKAARAPAARARERLEKHPASRGAFSFLRRNAFPFEAERRWLAAAFAQGVFCGSLFWRFISFEAPVIAGTSVLPVTKYAFAGPGGVLPLLTSLLAPPGLPLPALDMPVPPPPAANAKLGIKISATVAKDLSFIAFLRVLDVERDARQRARAGDVPRSRHAGIVRVSALDCAMSRHRP